MTSQFFILGAHKTATSSMVTMLNSHPRILCLYEVNLVNPFITRYGRKLLNFDPKLRPFFGELNDGIDNYHLMHEYLNSYYREYICFGDKIPIPSNDLFYKHSGKEKFFCIRNVRTWLAKKTTKKLYHTKFNIVPAAVDYAIFFLSSFKIKKSNLFHIRFEDFLIPDSKIPLDVANFLNIDCPDEMKQWWNGIGVTMEGDVLKKSLDYLKGHHSSLTKPTVQDTKVEITNHEFWDSFLPIFDFYYERINTSIENDVISKDIKSLRRIRNTYSLSLRDAFKKVDTKSLNSSPESLLDISIKKLGKKLRRIGSSLNRGKNIL
jgi:hypothetical protein